MSTAPRPEEPKPRGPQGPRSGESRPRRTKPKPKPEEPNVLVDLKVMSNNEKHHTKDMSSDALIVRRGQSFRIALKFKETFDPAQTLTFTAFTGEHAEEDRGTKSVFGIPDTVQRSPKAKAVWKAKRTIDPKDGTVVVTITPPAIAPVGVYKLLLNYRGEDTPLAIMGLLFNPWCIDDSVHMASDHQRQEYVMNEHGIIYKGSGQYIFPMDWDYGQFEEDMVEIALGILHVSPNYLADPAKDEEDRWDPGYVGRVVSCMINSEGDNGVLEGRWSTPYFGGKPPTHWSGSYPILKKWRDSGCHPVKYGQCWVFAGVMCSVMRALGIPCRVITNFESAHDVDQNLTIDVYHSGYGVPPINSPDSVWNFHVWVEGWMQRPDLPVGFGGWQVLDPTPQELSGKRYQCGPASVKAIKNGNTDKAHDVPFVYAEVNADCVDWLVLLDGSKKKIMTDSKRVGQNISTKSLGSDKRKPLSNRYKFKEGTKLERTTFEYAVTRDYSDYFSEVDSEESQSEPEPEPEKPPTPPPVDPEDLPKVFLKFEEGSKPVNGEDVKVNLVLHSEATVPRPLVVNLSVVAKSINGSSRIEIQSELQNQTLLPGQDLSLPIEVPFSKYWSPMLDNDVMKISAIVSDVEEEEKVYMAEHDLVLEDPPINLKVMNEARVHRKLEMMISFRNPVEEKLKGCSLTLSGSGLWREEQEIKLPDLAPKSTIRVKIYFWPYKAGQRTCVADFDCSVFRDIKKSIPINVK